MKQKIKLLLLVFLTASLKAYSQEAPIGHRDAEGYKKWSNARLSLRTAIGIQKAFYTELGISRHKYYYNDLGFASSASYAAVEWMPLLNTDTKSVVGAKLGYEINGRALALGIEAKYLTNGAEKDFLLAPKVGLGLLGVVNTFYGYHISFNKHPFTELGNHQFSLVFNLNRHILRRLKAA